MMAGKFQESCAYPPRLMNADRADLTFPTTSTGEVGKVGRQRSLKLQVGKIDWVPGGWPAPLPAGSMSLRFA